MCKCIVGHTEETWDGCYLLHEEDLNELDKIKGGYFVTYFSYCPFCGRSLETKEEGVKRLVADYHFRDGTVHEDGSIGTIRISPGQLQDLLKRCRDEAL